MKKFLIKILAFLGVFAPLSLCSFAAADTGVTYTGTLSQFLIQEKSEVTATLDATYQRVYAKFQASGLNLMKTLNYQSLLCLGVVKQDDSLISKLQKDRQALRLAFLRDFLDLDTEVATLEEKNRIQGETDISLFEPGTSYASEKARIENKVAQTKNLHLGFIRSFENTQSEKLQEFIQIVRNYSRENTGVLNFVNDKIRKMQSIDEFMSTLNSGVNQINAALIGTGTDFLASATSVRRGFMKGFEGRLQALINAALRRYKHPALEDMLENEKEFAVGNYGLDFDEKMNDIIDDWYSKSQYEDIKSQIAKFKTDFANGAQLNCTKMYASPAVFENRINALLSKVQSLTSGLAVGLETASKAGASQKLKSDLLVGFTTFNKQNLNKKIAEFRKVIKEKAAEAEGGTTTTSLTTEITTSSAPISITFTRAFRKGEKGDTVKALQELLKNNGYYAGEINGIFTAETIQGIYQFQLRNGLLAGYENKPATRGWMGPATRAKLNELAATQ